MTFTSILLVEVRAFESGGEKAVAFSVVGRSERGRASVTWAAASPLRKAIEEVEITEEELAAFAAIKGRADSLTQINTDGHG